MSGALSFLGLVRRAGQLRYGYDTVTGAIRAQEAKLVLLAVDLSEKTKKNVRFEAERGGVPCLQTVYTMEEMRLAMGKHTGILGVTEAGFAQKLQKDLRTAEEREVTCR